MEFVCPAVMLLQHQQQICQGLLECMLRGRGCDLSALLLTAYCISSKCHHLYLASVFENNCGGCEVSFALVSPGNAGHTVGMSLCWHGPPNA